MIYILPILFTIIFILIIIYFQFFKVDGIKTSIIAGIFILKLLAGIGVYGLYTYYYDSETADIYKYYNSGVQIYNSTENNFDDYLRIVTGIQIDMPHIKDRYFPVGYWSREYDYGLFVDNKTMIRFHALLCLISQGNIYLHIVIMAFLSFLGAFALFKALITINDANRYLLLFAATLIPSALFWTSGMLKEGLVMFSMGLMFYYFVKLMNKINFFDLLLFVLFAALLFISKIYILPALVPALVFLFITKKMRKRHQIIAFFSVLIFYSVFVLFSSNIIGYDIIRTVAGKQNDFINHANLIEENGSTIVLERLKPTAVSIIKNTPTAILNSFLRPYPTEINSVLMFLAFIENLFVLCLIVIMIFYFKKFNTQRFRFVLFSVLIIIVFYTLVGLSTPNIGAIVRYKVPVLPFLLASIFCLTDFNKINQKWFKKLFP